MGATTFTATATGKTAADAYRKACDEARDYNGHREGYSGDIQTTRGFSMVTVDVPKGSHAATRRRLISEAVDKNMDRFEKWGACGCIDLGREKGMPRGHREFLFFGWAAE